MKRYKKLRLLFVIVLFFFFEFCGGNGNGYISKGKLVKDIDYYTNVINEAHAEPYRMISKQEFEKKAAELKNHIRSMKSDNIPVTDCFFLVQELTALIQDPHTRVDFPYQSLKESDLFFPFELKVIAGKVFIINKLAENGIPLYAEILKINHTPIKALMSKCYKLFNTSIEHSKWSFFEYFFQLYLPTYLDLPSPWLVTYKSDSQTREAEVKGIPISQYLPNLQIDTQYKESSFKVNGETIPLLDIPSFAHGSGEDYRNFIDTFFEKYKNANYLVIDLRKNLGGSGTWGFFLLDYITASPYITSKRFDFKVSDILRDSQYSNKAGDKLQKAKNGTYLPIGTKEIRRPQQKANQFRGRVFLLTSRYTYSAGEVTAAIFKYHKMGTIIGQETLGTEKFCSDPVPLQMPNTKLAVNLPLAIYELPGKNPDRGVVPDILTVYSIADYQNQKDKELDKVRELIKKEKTSSQPRIIPAAGKQVAIKEGIPGGVIVGYWLYLPGNHNYTKKWPVILFLQGINAIGGAMERSKEWGPVKYALEGNDDYPELKSLIGDNFIIINPHMTAGGYWDRQWFEHTGALQEIVNHVMERYHGDPTRLYVTGLSFGGRGTWGLAVRWQKRIAAIMPVCGAIDRAGDLTTIKDLPVWMTCNTGDAVSMYNAQKRAAAIIEESGGEKFLRLDTAAPTADDYLSQHHIFTSFKRKGHDAWTATYNKPHIYHWLLRFSKNPELL